MGLQLRIAARKCNVAEKDNPVKVLGLWWDTHSDLIYPSPKPDVSPFTTASTKREILKWASTIFDPLGFITPATKLFLRNLWQQKIGWDTKLNEELSTVWSKISSDVTQATAMSFPRQCTPLLPTSDDTTLHIFTDASLQAYEAVIYMLKGTHSTTLMKIATLSLVTIYQLASTLSSSSTS